MKTQFNDTLNKLRPVGVLTYSSKRNLELNKEYRFKKDKIYLIKLFSSLSSIYYFSFILGNIITSNVFEDKFPQGNTTLIDYNGHNLCNIAIVSDSSIIVDVYNIENSTDIGSSIAPTLTGEVYELASIEDLSL